jgi:hypothetical protein
MRSARTIPALALLASLAGCYPPTQSGYSPTVFEQPQPVHFFYGRLIQIRAASLEYGNDVGIGATAVARWPVSAGIHVGGAGTAGGARISAGVVDVYFGGTVANLPALEYTVFLDRGTNPPDPYTADPQAAAIIVVQSPEEQLALNQHVVVRVVGKSGRVMSNPMTALGPDAQIVENRLSAGPMPIPLPCPPSVTGCSAYGHGGSVASAAPSPPPPILPRCTLCNQTSTTIRNSWGPH